MNHDDHLKAHLKLCQRIYERMLREGSWPWQGDDSPKSEDLVDSDSP